MAKELFISLRRFAAIGSVLLLLSFCLSVAATAQVEVPAPPFVVSSAGFSPAHTFNTSPTITGCAVAPTGDVVCVDLNNNRLWHFPVDGRAVQDVGWISSEHAWKNNYGLGIDSKMNLYVGGNYAINGIYKIPYDSVSKTWSMSNAVAFVNGGGLVPNPPDFTQTCGSANNCWGFQPSVIAVDPQDNLVVGTVGGAPDKLEIFTLPVNPDGTANLAGGQLKVWGLKATAQSIAVDAAGNIYFVEGGQPGLFMLPAGQIAIGDGSGSMEWGPDGLPQAPLVRLDPLAADSPVVPDAANKAKFLLGSIQGVALDAAGNLYYGDQYTGFNDPNVAGGIWMMPREGEALNPAHTILLTPIAIRGALAIDSKAGVLWASVSGTWNGLQDVARITFGNADLGSAAAGTQGSTVTIFNAFNTTNTTTNDTVKIDFALLSQGNGSNFADTGGGSCAVGNYFQNDRCTWLVAFKPAANVVGEVQGGVVVRQDVQIGQDAKGVPIYQRPYPVVSAMILHGLATSGELAFFNNPVESVVGKDIAGAGQVATDSAGNVYVAASTSVLVFPPNATESTTPVSVGKDLSAPTGVAIDGMGNVFIADSGKVIEVPFQEMVTGQDSSGNPIVGWGLNPDAQTIIKTGLGNSVKLAVNAAGYLFVADPDNGRVLQIKIYYPPSQAATIAPPTSGVAAATEEEISVADLSGIGLDATGNLLIADGANAIQVNGQGQQTIIAGSIGVANALAMDPSGALYYSTATGAFRVPVESGALNVANKAPLGIGVTAAAGLALGARGSVFLADVTNSNLHVVAVDGTVNFGAINLGDHPSLDSLVYNIGNADVTFNLTDGLFPSESELWMGMTTLNFIAAPSAANGCVDSAPLEPGNACSVTTTFNPDNGREQELDGSITMSGTGIANAAVNLYTTGVGADLAPSKTVMVVDPSVNANSAKIDITVTPATGTGTPAGRVTVLIDNVAKETKTIGADGKASFDLHPVKAGNHQYTAAYEGDRVFGRSTDVQPIKVAKGVTSLVQPPLLAIAGDQRSMWLPYVLISNQNADPYYYHYPVQVIAGESMLPTPNECKTYQTTDPCGKVVLLDSANAIQNNQKASDTTGIADVISSNFDYNHDSTALHPVQWYTVTPVYYGDDNYLPATGTPVTFAAVRVPSVYIDRVDSQGTPIAEATLSVSAGSTTTASFRARSMFGFGDLAPFTGQAEFHCDNLPPYAACSFSPARATVNAATNGFTTVTITTNVPVGTVTEYRNSSTPWLFAAMFGFGAIGLVFGRKSRLKGNLLIAICAILIISGALAGITACSTSTGASPNPAAKTPAGSYDVTISASQVGAAPTGNGWEQDWASVPYTIKVNVQ
jgi:Bacterial Ig-like domain (group 3)